jgi:hypothetical protein
MDEIFDQSTLERFRAMRPRDVYAEARDAVYRLGSTTSEQFRDVFEELVDKGVLTWSQIEEFEKR